MEALAALFLLCLLVGLILLLVDCLTDEPSTDAVEEAEARLRAMAAAYEVTERAARAQRRMYEEALRRQGEGDAPGP